MQGGHGIGAYTFAAMRAAHLSAFWSSVVFLLALFGFGAKAGLLPLHVWLPEAHPAAPSPVSALMSGIMLKTAIYGILRVTFDLLANSLDGQQWWWGVLALALGLITAIFGVMFAAVQGDMKRLLAYSSIENIGLLLVGIGLAIIFHVYGKDALAALSLTAMLYHSLNHAFFKSLLFIGTGSISACDRRAQHGAHGRPDPAHAVGRGADAGRRAVDIRPAAVQRIRVGMAAAAGVSAVAGLAQQLHQHADTGGGGGDRAGGRAGGLCDGEILRGHLPRPAARRGAWNMPHDAGIWERIGLGWLAFGCVVLGLAPVFVVRQLDLVTQVLVGRGLGNAAPGWLFLAPVDIERASYSPVYFLLAVLGVMLVTALVVHRFYHGRLRRGPAWDCGFPAQTSRMQDTAEGFGQPIRRIFEPFFRIERELPSAFDTHPRYHGRSDDRFWFALYLPIKHITEKLSSLGIAVAARTHPFVSDVYLCHAGRVAGVCMMEHSNQALGILFQLYQSLLVVLLAPLLTGWVNQCRAWLQNRSGPGVLQPYRTLRKLFHKDAVMAYNASPLFRVTPYILFGCMWLAAAIIPIIAVDLPFSPAADVIALVGVFALARVFIALAAMDIGTAFGTLGARREMLVSFLAEPALLMVFFTASLISHSTQLPRIVDALAHHQFVLYPSLAFAGLAFVIVLLAENARIPVDNPSTHLELTMIHEAMILEYSARHLALVEWASSLKLFAYISIGIALFAAATALPRWAIGARCRWPSSRCWSS